MSMRIDRLVAFLLVVLSLALLFPLSAQAQQPAVVLINIFDVPPGQEEATQRFWERARDFLKTQPGYVNTRLHKNIDSKGRFQLINIAEWNSPQAFQAASQAMAKTLTDNPPPPGVTFTPGLFRVVAQ